VSVGAVDADLDVDASGLDGLGPFVNSITTFPVALA
jgi:hypothetical protein